MKMPITNAIKSDRITNDEVISPSVSSGWEYGIDVATIGSIRGSTSSPFDALISRRFSSAGERNPSARMVETRLGAGGTSSSLSKAVAVRQFMKGIGVNVGMDEAVFPSLLQSGNGSKSPGAASRSCAYVAEPTSFAIGQSEQTFA
jgi:hypothetical protein